MKTAIKYYALIIVLSLLPLTSIFATPLLFHTHDGYVHLARIAAYYKALKDAEFPVRWAGSLNFGYGMPLFNFMYQVPYALASMIISIGVNLVNAFKIVIALSYPLAGITMLAFAYEFFQDYRKAFLLSVFYQFAPFRLVELLVRGSFGEVYTYAFFPLVLLGILKSQKKFSFGNLLLTSTATALLILSHNALSLIFFGLSLGFILLISLENKNIFRTGIGLFIGLALAAFYWLPAITEHKYTYGDLFMKDLYREHFPPIQNFFIPNFFNDFHLQTKGISVQIGIFHVLVFPVSIITLFNKKIDKQIKMLLLWCLLIFFMTLFIMQPQSKFIWEHVALLRQFQFSWRFLGVISFITALMAIAFFSYGFINNLWIYISIIFLTIFSTVFYWRPPLGYDRINESYYWNYPLTSTYFGETDVIWSAGPAKSYPKSRIEFISGKGMINNFKHNTHSQSFAVSAINQSVLVDHLEYYPGWRVEVNNRPVQIQFQDPNWRGQIIFSVPSGNSSVKVWFGETPLRLGADLLSLATAIFLIVIGIFRKKVFYEKKRI